VKDFLANWNISAHNWLKYYVYLRQLDNSKRTSVNFRSTFLTFLMSAIWHGFYPGYYIFFTGAGLMDYHSKLAERALSPFVKGVPELGLKVFGYLWSYIGCAYFSIGFTLLSVEKFH
jgi:lysophospholipid acyltransferase